MAEAGAVTRLEEDLACPICLDIYETPVSLSCDHSFCKKCVQEALRQSPQGPFSCSLCCAQADPAVELQPNVQLSSTVQKLLDVSVHQEKEEHEAPHGETMKSSGQQEEVIPCDFCLEEPQPAVKTCLSCEFSLCQAHLSKHSTKSTQKDHVLVEPCGAQFLAERRCPEHGRLLECYCKTDSSVFPEVLETVKQHEAALNQSISNLLQQEDEVQTKESLQRNRLESLFKEMGLQLDNQKTEVLKALSHSEEQQLSEIRAEIQKRKEEKDAASCDVQELKALKDQKDLILFLKAFAAIGARKRNPVPNRDGVELPTPPITLDDLTVQATLRLFRQFLSGMQSLFKSPPVHEHLTALVYQQRYGYSAPSLGSPVSSKTISPSSSSGGGSAVPHLQSEQSFSEGCHFWEVDISKARGWKLGIVRSSFECFLIEISKSLYVFLGQTMIAAKDFPAPLKAVRVELDCGRNTLSFYNASLGDVNAAEGLGLIETVSIPSNYPAFASFGVCDGSLQLL